jgi:putative membrane protein
LAHNPDRETTNPQGLQMSAAIMAFIHHLAAFTLFASILFEHLTFKRDLTLAGAKRLLAVDIVYGVSAVTVLAAGFARALHFEKGWDYYSTNAFFWIKLGAFALAALLSIYPTLTFLTWRKSLKQNILPTVPEAAFKRITWLLRLEMLCLLVILFAAAMMARGIGMI